MKASIRINHHDIAISTEHAASSYGQPVVLLDGELTDIEALYTPDECECNLLDMLADIAHVWRGAQTRRELRALAEETLGDDPTGADYDAVIAEFKRRGAESEI